LRNLRKNKSRLWLTVLTLVVSLLGCGPAAMASAQYTPLKVPSLAANSERTQALGGVKIVADAGSLSAGDVLIIQLPDEVTLTYAKDNPDADLFVISNDVNQAPNLLFVPDTVSRGVPNGIKADDVALLGVADDEIQIQMLNDASMVDDAYLYLYLRSVIVGDRASGELMLTFEAPANSGFLVSGGTNQGEVIQGKAPQKTKPTEPVEPPTEIKQTAVFTLGRTDYMVGSQTRTMDVAPYSSAGRVFLPLRYVGYALGIAEADIRWDDASKTATLTKGDMVVQVKRGSTTLLVNGTATLMDVAPQIKDGRTMLPFRYLGQAFGADISWDEVKQTVTLNL